MRERIWLFFVSLKHLFDWGDCEKESMGYTCRHQMHGNVPECGSWSTVRRIK